jgi:hypothetical protein
LLGERYEACVRSGLGLRKQALKSERRMGITAARIKSIELCRKYAILKGRHLYNALIYWTSCSLKAEFG